MTTQGATPGRRLVGIRVITVAGTNPDWAHALLRQIPYLVSLPLIPLVQNPLHPLWLILFAAFVADILWMLRDERYRTLHDRLAGTFVARNAAVP